MMRADSMPSAEDLLAMFVEYRVTRSRALRNELIEAHEALASSLARRFANRGVPAEDLAQVARIGMLHAVERFDPDRKFEFSSFAIATVNGELKRHFRDKTWAVHVPRGTQELHGRIEPARAALAAQLHRAPTTAEIAVALDCSEQLATLAISAGNGYNSASLDATRPDGGASLRERELACVDVGFDRAEERVLLADILSSLPPREQRMLELRFYGEMTQTEIGEHMGMSQMHVSRLMVRSLARLRLTLSAA